MRRGDDDLAEVPLTGGRMTPGVVRVGDTVRRPVGPMTPAVADAFTGEAARGTTPVVPHPDREGGSA